MFFFYFFITIIVLGKAAFTVARLERRGRRGRRVTRDEVFTVERRLWPMPGEWRGKFDVSMMEYQWELYNHEVVLWKRKIAACIYLSKCERRRPKRFHVRPLYLKRREKGFYHNLLQEMRLGDQEQFFNFHRMSTNKFDELLTLVGPIIEKTTLLRDDVISPAERLSLTLRYLASGDSMSSLTFSFRMSKSSVSNIVAETCSAIWLVLSKTVFMTPTEENWTAVANRFLQQWNFPHCVGAIDGKHVVMQAPNKAGSTYFNYKGTHSLVLLAVCDADYCFTLVDIGSSGRQSDGGIFRYSAFGQAILQNELNLPAPRSIPGTDGRVSPFLFVGDAAFPMSNTLMRPYPLRSLTVKQRVYNYRLSRARRVIENSFGIMVARWRIFRRPVIAKLSNLEKIIQAVVCLHNWLQAANQKLPTRDRKYCPRTFVDGVTVEGVVQEGEWRVEVEENGAIQNLGRLGTNMYTRSAERTRDNLAEYFMQEGMVPWQWNSIGLGALEELQQ